MYTRVPVFLRPHFVIHGSKGQGKTMRLSDLLLGPWGGSARVWPWGRGNHTVNRGARGCVECRGERLRPGARERVPGVWPGVSTCTVPPEHVTIGAAVPQARTPPGPASGPRAPPSGGSGEPRRAARPPPPPRLRTPGRLRRRKAARPSRGPQFPVRPRPPAPLARRAPWAPHPSPPTDGSWAGASASAPPGGRREAGLLGPSPARRAGVSGPCRPAARLAPFAAQQGCPHRAPVSPPCGGWTCGVPVPDADPPGRLGTGPAASAPPPGGGWVLSSPPTAPWAAASHLGGRGCTFPSSPPQSHCRGLGGFSPVAPSEPPPPTVWLPALGWRSTAPPWGSLNPRVPSLSWRAWG